MGALGAPSTLALVAWAAWVCGPVTSSWKISYGHIAVTSPGYVGSIWSDAKRDSEPHTIMSVWSRPLALLECTRACVGMGDCHSFVINTENTLCLLSYYDYCASEKKQLMLRNPSMQIFEVRAGAPHRPATSCFNHWAPGCEKYGRPECWGETCDQCPHFCWNISETHTESSTRVWTHHTPTTVDCDQGWQSIWSYNYFLKDGERGLRVYDLLLSIPLKLRVTLVYTDGTAVHAYFLDILYGERRISVGDFAGGKAGNSWRAPFRDRPVSSFPDSNCLPFFYPEGESCTAGGVDLGQRATRGFAWVTNDALLDNTRIEDIVLWVKPQNDEGLTNWSPQLTKPGEG